MIQFIAVMLAIVVGYLCPRLPLKMQILNWCVTLSIQCILLIMGYQFGSSSLTLMSEIINLSKVVLIFVCCIFCINWLCISFTCRKFTPLFRQILHGQKINLFHHIIASVKYLAYVICGITLGYFIKVQLYYINLIVNVLLLEVLCIIGYQLKSQNIALKSILVNRIGLIVALSIIVSSIIAGMLAGLFSGVGIKIGMVLASGFGWYTLSSILTGTLINQQMGTVGFFIDFARELIALVMVPAVGARYPLQSIGYCAATAMDYTLPVIKENISADAVPVAIASGMLLSALVPLLIPVIIQL